ncbi:ATP-binding protein [Roseibaca calidilacus]|uniref:hybrid sensor histidine kinase/response regulator n=1 Tax=Roseibaca calidilacus TaxID=1666912 RepID=UPI0009EAE878|nr:ATP-binding protein [Roseibaca calidilacus]
MFGPTAGQLLGLVATVGAALLLVALLADLSGPISLALWAVGASILCSVCLLAAWQWHVRQRLRRDLTVVSALYGSAPATALVDGAAGKVVWANAAATQRLAGATHAMAFLEDISADPAELVARLHDRALAEGQITHSVAVDTGELRLTLRPAGHGRTLWQLDETSAPDLRDQLPFDMIHSYPDGRITYLSPRLAALASAKPKHVADLLKLPLPKAGEPGIFTLRDSGERHNGLRITTEDANELVVLISPANPDNTHQDFNALQMLPIAVALIDRDGVLIRANDETRRILRLRKEDKRRFCDLLEGLGRPVGEWLADLRAGRVTTATEVLRVNNPADDLFLQVSLRSYGTDGELVAIMHDATEFKALEAKFTQSQKMQAIGQLAGGVAHDFNNLLTAISGHCDLILLRHDRSDVDYPDLMQIQQNTNRAAALVRQLLAFSRKQTLQFETLDLHDLLADAIHLLNRLVGERVTLTLRHGVDMPLIRSDKRQFEQVLMNLVVNARDAMPMGGEIVIETEHCALPNGLRRDKVMLPPGNYAVIRVRDEGIGMSSTTKAKVFDPFFSTKRQGEGTGLGLSTVYGIIKQSGGFIFVDSEEGHGTTFSIYLAAQAAPSVKPQKPAKPKAPAAATPRSTVLLVEDEAPVRSFAARALQLQGHRVLEADSGEAALALLQDPAVRPDVFVSDVIMPGLDGPGWVAQIRDRFPNTPIVFMSGYAEDSRIAAQAEFGQAVFIGKPFSLAEFTGLVNEQLRKLSEAA